MSITTTTNPSIFTTEQEQRWSKDARIYEYGSAVNPEMPPIPVLVHPPELHESGPTRIIPFDISKHMEIENGEATSPNLMANFIRINVGDTIPTKATATSQAFYVIRGSGTTTSEHGTVTWETGDMIVVPVTPGEMIHTCTQADLGGAALYWIHDQPLMDYLGVSPSGVKKFEPTLYKKSDMLAKVEEIRHDQNRSNNRLGVLLGNAKCAQTKTLTHVLWSLLNSIPGNSVQRPHRHNSVALDLCVSASPNVYTLMGREIDDNGFIIDPIRCDWSPGGVFVTPPGWWHSHHNESNEVAWVLPIQDAGLFTHQRTLDIRFVDDELALHHSGRIRGSAFVVSDDQFLKMKDLSAQLPQAASYDTQVVTADDKSSVAGAVAPGSRYLANNDVIIEQAEKEGEEKKDVDDCDDEGRCGHLTSLDRPGMFQRRATIQVGHLARAGRSISGGKGTTQHHRRRTSIQVGADLDYVKSLSRSVTTF